jgi:hypothetical protein
MARDGTASLLSRPSHWRQAALSRDSFEVGERAGTSFAKYMDESTTFRLVRGSISRVSTLSARTAKANMRTIAFLGGIDGYGRGNRSL